MKLSPELTAACLALAGEAPAPASSPAARTKYGSRATVVDGVRFDSAKEARRWGELELMAAAGLIRNLRRQVPYEIVVNGDKVCTYIADAVYETADLTIVEDVKSVFTRKNPVYRLKKKLMQAVHNIEIHEV